MSDKKTNEERRQFELDVLHELMKPQMFRTPYEPHKRQAMAPCASKTPSRTKQAFKDECDINKIMRKWEKQQTITHVRDGMPSYGDFSNAMEYKEAADRVLAANEAFMQLPAGVRARVNNSPAQFLDFIGDPENRAELEELGLVAPRQGGERVARPAADGSPAATGEAAGTPAPPVPSNQPGAEGD